MFYCASVYQMVSNKSFHKTCVCPYCTALSKYRGTTFHVTSSFKWTPRTKSVELISRPVELVNESNKHPCQSKRGMQQSHAYIHITGNNMNPIIQLKHVVHSYPETSQTVYTRRDFIWVTRVYKTVLIIGWFVLLIHLRILIGVVFWIR
jgi:hypothetical protein